MSLQALHEFVLCLPRETSQCNEYAIDGSTCMIDTTEWLDSEWRYMSLREQSICKNIMESLTRYLQENGLAGNRAAIVEYKSILKCWEKISRLAVERAGKQTSQEAAQGGRALIDVQCVTYWIFKKSRASGTGMLIGEDRKKEWD